MRLIDADLLVKKLRMLLKDFKNAPTKKYVIKIILSMLGDENQMPTTEAEPVVHGHWVDTVLGTIRCSKCSMAFNLVGKYIYYCPHCGAKMDEEAK